MSRRPSPRRSSTDRDDRDPERRPFGGAAGAEGASGGGAEGEAEPGIVVSQGSGSDLDGGAASLDRLLDPTQLAELLGVSLRLVRRLVNERRIPYVKVGKLVRFEPADVRTYVATCKVKPNTSRRHDVGL